MNVPVTADIGDLLGEIRDGLVGEVQRRLADLGYSDVRASHDCVFRHLTPEGVRLRDLAALSRLTAPAIGEHVDELERLGYVERVADPSDRRAKLIRPTERGAKFMQAAYTALAEIQDEWAGGLGLDALLELREALAQVRALQQSLASPRFMQPETGGGSVPADARGAGRRRG
jgi:DNA-binding MarR family transcriptional regulator